MRRPWLLGASRIREEPPTLALSPPRREARGQEGATLTKMLPDDVVGRVTPIPCGDSSTLGTVLRARSEREAATGLDGCRREMPLKA